MGPPLGPVLQGQIRPILLNPAMGLQQTMPLASSDNFVNRHISRSLAWIYQYLHLSQVWAATIASTGPIFPG